MYTAGITARAVHVAQAQNLIELLNGAGQHEHRQRAGFISRRN
jgi:molybdate transport system substrate-binding protein